MGKTKVGNMRFRKLVMWLMWKLEREAL